VRTFLDFVLLSIATSAAPVHVIIRCIPLTAPIRRKRMGMPVTGCLSCLTDAVPPTLEAFRFSIPAEVAIGISFSYMVFMVFHTVDHESSRSG